jgi:hypothetical protein
VPCPTYFILCYLQYFCAKPNNKGFNLYLIVMRIYVHLHKYLFTYLFFKYNYYAITILPIMHFTHSQTMSKHMKINIFIILHKFIIWHFQLFITIFFPQVKVFPKASNIHLYIKQNYIVIKLLTLNYMPIFKMKCLT